MMKIRFAVLAILTSCLAWAHFQLVIPSTEVVNKPVTLTLDLRFTHPMANGPVMNMGPVKHFGVMIGGKKVDLSKSLRKVTVDGKATYRGTCAVKRPGDHLFYLEPSPYWEPVEKKMIIHYTKVCVSSMGIHDGWDKLVGFPVEIEPLTRPYGLYAGNAFRGIVKKNGRPVPFARVEVELLNDKNRYTSPDDVFTTQVVKADANGVFSYTMPVAGWWGFAALVDGDKKMTSPTGKQVDVELGGLIWVRSREMIRK